MARNDRMIPQLAQRVANTEAAFDSPFRGNIVSPGIRTGGGATRQAMPQAPMSFPQQPVGLPPAPVPGVPVPHTGGPLGAYAAGLPSPYGPPAGQFGQGFGYGMTRPRAPTRGTSY